MHSILRRLALHRGGSMQLQRAWDAVALAEAEAQAEVLAEAKRTQAYLVTFVHGAYSAATGNRDVLQEMDFMVPQTSTTYNACQAMAGQRPTLI